MATRKTKQPKRSAFDQLSPAAPSATMQPAASTLPEFGPAGTAGLRLAVEKKRTRNWEREHQYGKGYSVKGVRPDLNLWLLATADTLGVRVAEVAVFALRHAMDLVDSGELKVKPSANPRGALMTLFPAGYEQSGGEEVQAALLQLAGKNKAARGKGRVGKRKAKAQAGEDWKSKPVNWTPFDPALRARIVEHCRDRVPQGEFVSFLLERARADHQAGRLIFKPQPKVIPDEPVG
jgi:hypothetical protein